MSVSKVCCSNPCKLRLFRFHSVDGVYIFIYKIPVTKIVRTLWLAERSVCMRVCKHGCDVKMFCFSRANHVQNSTSLLYLPIPLSAESWKSFTNKLCQFCFRLSRHFKLEKSVFWKHLFAKQELITRATLRLHFVTGKNLSFNQCHNKAFCVLRFSLESYFMKAIENFFPVFA